MKKYAFLPVFLALIACTSNAQQDKSQRPSPPASAECTLAAGKTVKIDYSSPRMKGRKIYGGLVPYGQIWRSGANEATTLVFSPSFTIGGQGLPSNYTIFTIPEADKWTLVISKKTGEWGTDYPGESEDLLRVPMTVSKTSGPVENFTITFDQSGGKCTLNMDWENTRASAEIAGK